MLGPGNSSPMRLRMVRARVLGAKEMMSRSSVGNQEAESAGTHTAGTGSD